MKKYITLARAELLDAINNRGEMVLHVVLETVPIFVMSSLWISNQNGVINLGYSSSQLVTYYLIMLIISRATGFYFDQNAQEEIRSGSFSRFLLKPLSIPFAYIPQNIGGKIFHVGVLLSIILLVIAIVLGSHVLYPTLLNLIFFGTSLVAAYLIQYSLSVLVTAVAFYMEQSSAVIHLKWMFDVVAGGYMIPVDVYPIWLQSIINLLPFKYIYFVPASIVLSKFSFTQSLIQIGVGYIWVIILLFTSHTFWKRGVERYSAVGG